jgi:hypothetical protein
MRTSSRVPLTLPTSTAGAPHTFMIPRVITWLYLIPRLLLFYARYHLAKQCFLVPPPNENLDFSKPPLTFYTGSFSSNTLHVIRFLCLSPTSCYDNRVGCACHTMVSKTTFLFRLSLPPSNLSSNCPSCLTILQSTKRRLPSHLWRLGSGHLSRPLLGLIFHLFPSCSLIRAYFLLN